MKILRKYAFSICWFLIMCFLLFSPSGGLPKGRIFHIPHLDKLVHIAMFAIFVSAFLFDEWRAKGSSYNIFKLVLFCLFFGFLSEIIQAVYIEGREGTYQDFIADQLGLVLGLSFYFLFAERLLNNKQNKR